MARDITSPLDRPSAIMDCKLQHTTLATLLTMCTDCTSDKHQGIETSRLQRLIGHMVCACCTLEQACAQHAQCARLMVDPARHRGGASMRSRQMQAILLWASCHNCASDAPVQAGACGFLCVDARRASDRAIESIVARRWHRLNKE
jgi:hypothetical protein